MIETAAFDPQLLGSIFFGRQIVLSMLKDESCYATPGYDAIPRHNGSICIQSNTIKISFELSGLTITMEPEERSIRTATNYSTSLIHSFQIDANTANWCP